MANTGAKKDLDKLRKKAARLSRPTPVELPSGKWRCQIMVNGERLDVIDDDPEVAHAKALALKAGVIGKNKKSAPDVITVGQLVDQYISAHDSIFSPSTIDSYKRKRKNVLQDLMSKKVADLTKTIVQNSINNMAKSYSPKSVRDAYGLVSASLKFYDEDLVFKIRFPEKVKYTPEIPQPDEIDKIIEAAIGSNVELPILLSLCLGLRTAEIRGLTWDCMNGDKLHIKNALVDTVNGDVLKATKTFSSDRVLTMPAYLVDLINKQPKISGYIVPLTRRQIYNRFQTICKKANVGPFRFYDLRHANASVMLAVGIPDKYAMGEMGHSTTNMLKSVYQHLFVSEKDIAAKLRNDYFAERFKKNLHMNLHTENKKP